MIMFESMIERAARNGMQLDRTRLVNNGSLMLVAGTGTTAVSLTTAVYYLVKQPQLWYELKRQLLEKVGDASSQPDVVELERVPLLEAVVKEALRIGNPIRGRNPRVTPPGGWDFNGVHIPEGVRIPPFMHRVCLSADNDQRPLSPAPSCSIVLIRSFFLSLKSSSPRDGFSRILLS